MPQCKYNRPIAKKITLRRKPRLGTTKIPPRMAVEFSLFVALGSYFSTISLMHHQLPLAAVQVIFSFVVVTAPHVAALLTAPV